MALSELNKSAVALALAEKRRRWGWFKWIALAAFLGAIAGSILALI